MYRHQWNTRWAFAREPVIFTYEKITFAMGLYNKSRLSQKKLLKWNGLVFHWCLYHKLNITWLLEDTKFLFEWWIILYLGCVRWGNLDLDFKTDFNAEIFVFGFSFLPFDWEIRKRIWKTVLRKSGLPCTRKISKKKTAVHENSFAHPFSDFPIERQKGKSKKYGFGFLNWNPPWGRISRRWNPFSDFAFDWEIRI